MESRDKKVGAAAVDRKLVAAHRGGRSQWHENTIEAVEHAIACGADMVEFDVRRTADGELVVHHDEAVGERALAAMEYSEALRRSTALGYRIPRVAELLDIARGRILLDIEIKESDCEEALFGLLFERRFGPSEFAVTSFDAAVLDRVKRIHPEAILGLLVYDMTGEEALQRFHRAAVDFLGPDWRLLDDRMLETADQWRAPLLPWTVNDSAVVRSLLRAPAVLGVITDVTVEGLRIRDELAHGMRGSEQRLSWKTLSERRGSS